MSFRPPIRYAVRPLFEAAPFAPFDPKFTQELLTDLASGIRSLTGAYGLKCVSQLAPAEQMALFRQIECVIKNHTGQPIS